MRQIIGKFGSLISVVIVFLVSFVASYVIMTSLVIAFIPGAASDPSYLIKGSRLGVIAAFIAITLFVFGLVNRISIRIVCTEMIGITSGFISAALIGVHISCLRQLGVIGEVHRCLFFR